MSTNLSVSFELICLMGWLLKKDKPALQQLIQKALAGGVSESIVKLQAARPTELSDVMEKTVSEFFEYVEMVLAEGVPVVKSKSALSIESISEIKKIDQVSIDQRVLWLSVNQANESVAQKGSELNQAAKEALFKSEFYKSLLANWAVQIEDILN